MKTAELTYQAVLVNTSCADVHCLLSMDSSAIAAGFPAGDVGPVIDGVVLLGEPHALLQQKKYNTRVPIILGHSPILTRCGLDTM